MNTDTIAAAATAMTAAGLGIIRISGKEAFAVLKKIYRTKSGRVRQKEWESHRAYYGYIADGEEMVDEVLALVLKGPGSFTTEDTVEINCHGGAFVMQRILETVLKNGARHAEPGEFTKRAFLNGRIDLSQAEAVMDIIQAQNEYALKSSLMQLRGSVYEKIKEFREKIIHEAAFIESALDDPEHISLEGYPERLKKSVDEAAFEIDKLLRNSQNGRILKEGICTVIAGKPNAGKSSLLNLLAGEEKAIVTEIAGTTRDRIEESVRIEGIQLNLIDTAGIRETEDVVEKIGVVKAKKSLEEADLILYVVDSSTSLDENDREIIERMKQKKGIVLYNKTDLPPVTEEELLRKMIPHEVIPVSLKKGEGIEALGKKIKEMFLDGEIDSDKEMLITSVRHRQCLLDAYESLTEVKKSIENGMPEDFYSIDLMDAYASLGLIIGEEVEEDLVEQIFSKFCMGK